VNRGRYKSFSDEFEHGFIIETLQTSKPSSQTSNIQEIALVSVMSIEIQLF
jgi:hypothetical protein